MGAPDQRLNPAPLTPWGGRLVAVYESSSGRDGCPRLLSRFAGADELRTVKAQTSLAPSRRRNPECIFDAFNMADVL